MPYVSRKRSDFFVVFHWNKINQTTSKYTYGNGCGKTSTQHAHFKATKRDKAKMKDERVAATIHHENSPQRGSRSCEAQHSHTIRCAERRDPTSTDEEIRTAPADVSRSFLGEKAARENIDVQMKTFTEELSKHSKKKKRSSLKQRNEVN